MGNLSYSMDKRTESRRSRYYEQLRHDLRSELKRLLTMLGLSYDKERLDCVLRHSNGNSFKRESEELR